MGMDLSITYPGAAPAWPAVVAALASRGIKPQMRMIDGELAFPDEEPPEGWREIRLATPAGMVTLRRQAGRDTLVIWGNADAALLSGRDALAWACADAGGGSVGTPAGPASAEEFARTLPPA